MRRGVVVILSVLTCLGTLIPGCGSTGRVEAGGASGPVVPLESRIDAAPGRTLLIPVRAERSARPEVDVVLENGRRLKGRLYRVVVELDPRGSTWLSPAGVWRSVPAGTGEGELTSGPGLVSSMVVVDFPIDGSGRWLTVEGARTRLNVLGAVAAPGTVTGREDTLVEGPARGPGSALVDHLLEPERRSPVRRWRYRLLTARSLENGEAFEDPVIEALARQQESRWSWALRVLTRSDREVARRVASRLLALTDFGGGAVAPTWPDSQADTDALLSDLLDPGLTDVRRVERAEAFLLSLPDSVAWIIDDAGTPDAASGRPTVSLGVANLSARTVLAAAAMGEDLATAEPRELAPDSAARIFVIEPEGGADGVLTAAIGTRRFSTRALLSGLPAAPPGLALGPLARDYTLESWVAPGGSGVGVEPAWTTAGLLLRKEKSWTLFIECARAAGGAGASQEDTVRIWIGPTARPRLVLRVGESGYAHAEQVLAGPGSATDGADPARAVAVASRPGKWVCEVGLPSWCIEPDGTVRIGLERIDARGVRSAYPRPMLPWQTEPGRVMIDTGAWER